MISIRFFQARPKGVKTENYALCTADAEALLKDSFDEYEVLESSTFGNGVLVEARVDTELNLKYFKKRAELEGKVEIKNEE